MLCELELDIISDVVNKMIYCIELQMDKLSISINAPTKKVTADSTNNNAIDLTNDKAIDLTNDDTDPSTTTNAANPLKKMPEQHGEDNYKRPQLTWMDRTVAAFIYLHPGIYGTGINVNRPKKVSAATGANLNRVRHWFSLTDKQAAANIATWYQLAKHLNWAVVKKRFP